MGRTLGFTVINGKDMTDAEKEIMLAVSNKYNSGEFENVWTCENFYLNPWDFYPNWQTFDRLKTVIDVKEPWDFIEQKREECRAGGKSVRETYEWLHKAGLILFHNDKDEDTFGGFCKTGSNEYNSMLVFVALLEISVLTKAEIYLSDEGDFLLGEIIIKDGKVKFDKKAIKENWAYWKKSGYLDKESEDHTAKYCSKKYDDQKTILALYPGWTEPQNVCRTVDPEDFKDHPDYGAAQIMAGFQGEYWGLDTEDSEAMSLRMCAMMQGLFAGTDLKMEVAPKVVK